MKLKILLPLLLIFSYNLFSQTDQWFQQGVQSYTAGNTVKAKELFNKVIQIDPSHDKALYYLGMCHLLNKEFRKSIEYFSESIRYNKEFAEAYNSRGIAYSYEGDIDFAISDFDRALIIDPKFTQAYINRGSAFISNGNAPFAMQDFDEALKLDPKNPAVLFQRGRLHAGNQDLTNALNDYLAAIDYGMKSAEVYYEVGNTYFQMNKLNDAISYYTKAINIDPEHHQALNNRAVAYDKTGNSTKAEQDRKKLGQMAGVDFTAFEKLKFKTFKSSDNWINIDLPNGWFVTEIVKDQDQVEIILTPKKWVPGQSEPMAMVTISVQKNMSKRFGVSAPFELIDFWSSSNAMNSETYANYNVIQQKMKKFKGEYDSKLFETLMQIEQNAVIYQNYEFIAAKQDYMMYAYFQAPMNQFKYYRPIFDKAMESIELK